jgi:hypothetical protein
MVRSFIAPPRFHAELEVLLDDCKTLQNHPNVRVHREDHRGFLIRHKDPCYSEILSQDFGYPRQALLWMNLDVKLNQTLTLP